MSSTAREGFWSRAMNSADHMAGSQQRMVRNPLAPSIVIPIYLSWRGFLEEI